MRLLLLFLFSPFFLISQVQIGNDIDGVAAGNNRELKHLSINSSPSQFIQSSQKHIINAFKLASGLYYVEVVTDHGKAIKKLVIK